MNVLSNIVESVINNDNTNDFLFEYLKLIKSELDFDSLVYYILEGQTFTKKLLVGVDHTYTDLIKQDEIITLFDEASIIELNEFSQINILYKQCIVYAILIKSENDLSGLILIGTDNTNTQSNSSFHKITAYFQPIINITSNYKNYRQSIIDTCIKITSPILRSISHDVRNPIQMISILIEMLKAKDLSQEKRLVLHAKLTDGISQIDKIVTDVTDLFKKSCDINISQVPCHVFLQDIENKVISLLKKSKISFELNLGYNSTIEIDVEKIKDIIIKMIKYSIELIKDDGLIVLSVEEIDNNINILIIDTSDGIEPEILNNQKNPFFNLGNRLGTGLNFAIMHSIIEAHSGKLNIYNQENGGMVFDIVIPKKAT